MAHSRSAFFVAGRWRVGVCAVRGSSCFQLSTLLVMENGVHSGEPKWRPRERERERKSPKANKGSAAPYGVYEVHTYTAVRMDVDRACSSHGRTDFSKAQPIYSSNKYCCAIYNCCTAVLHSRNSVLSVPGTHVGGERGSVVVGTISPRALPHRYRLMLVPFFFAVW